MCDTFAERMCQSQRCALVNPALKGTLVDHAASSGDELVLHRKGKLQSHISKRLRSNTPSLDDRDQCAQCSKVAPHLQAHPFVIRHLLYRSVPDDFIDPCT